MSSNGYAGDLSPQQAYGLLSENPQTQLVDVRTAAEWGYVGCPDLSSLGKQAILIEWQQFPSGEPNPHFVEQVEKLGISKDSPIVLLCRSGQRSRFAAAALTQAGYQACYNILEGFEGDKDSDGHRGTVAGWKVAGLPWQQG
jgi:rhodanese-related sulfurtransferase